MRIALVDDTAEELKILSDIINKELPHSTVFTFPSGESFLEAWDDNSYDLGDICWIKVEPIKWLVDERANIALSKKIIFSGVQFKNRRDYKGDFDRTDIKQFMDKHFSKDIKATATMSYSTSEVKEKFKVEERKSRLQKLNPDTTNPQDRRRMTDTEIIHSWIEAGQSVLLRGPSGIGKTERIKTLYPNLIYIKLTNNMFPEKVVGSMNLQTGQNIPPDFAKQALLSCATSEEEKLVRESIQNLYDIADDIYESRAGRKARAGGSVLLLPRYEGSGCG
mgnify:CR=1 FL=1